MKFWIKTMLAVSILCLSACSDDPDVAPLMRDTDAVELAYNAGAASRISVRYSGPWTARAVCVDDQGNPVENWFTISPENGVGNGSDYQWVTVTAKRNSGDKRMGYLYLSPTGGEEVKVAITQAAGVFTVKDPVIKGVLKSGVPSAASLDITYDKAFGGESIVVSTTLSGASEGLAIKGVFETTIEREGSGVISVPITGTPMSLGGLVCTVKFVMDGKTIFDGEIAGSVSSANEIFRMGFDLFVWGGEYIADKPGISPMPGGGEATADYQGTEPDGGKGVTAGTNGAKDVFNTMSAVYRANRGVTEWKGLRCYERPGYIRLGTGSNAGYIMTPPLSALSSSPQTVVLSIDVCRCDNEVGVYTITAENAGTVLNGTLNEMTLPAPTKASERKWTTLSFTIEGATNRTQVKIQAEKDAAGYRLNLDNVVVMGASKPQISEPLEKPDVASIVVKSTQTSFAISWGAVKNADAYDVELVDITRPQFSYKKRVATNDIEIEDIASGYYDLKLTAVWVDDEKLNSETVTKTIATKDVRTEPLDSPTKLAYTNKGYAMTVTWDAVTDATGYAVSLLDGQTVVQRANVDAQTYTFTNLEGGEKSYTLSVVATFKANPKLNSVAATKAVKTLPNMTAPVLRIFEKTHALAVVEWSLSADALAQQPLANSETYDFRVKNASGAVVRSFDNFSKFSFTKYSRLRFVWGGLNPGVKYTIEMRRKAASATLDKCVDSKWASVAVTTDAAPNAAGYLLYKDFDNFPVGAQPLFGAYGFSMGSTTDFSDPDKILLATGDANSIYTQGVKTTESYFAAYLPEWDMDEWSSVSSNIGIGAGYVKFGGGTKPAWLTLPKLTALTAATDIYLEMDTCPYIEPSAAGDMMTPSNTDLIEYYYVVVTGGGRITEVTGETSASAVIESDGSQVKLRNVMTDKMKAEGLTDRYRFTSQKIKISGATAQTRIKIYTGLNNDGKNYRMWLDNLRVKKVN